MCCNWTYSCFVRQLVKAARYVEMGSNPWRKYEFWVAIVVTTIVLWVWRHSSFRSLSRSLSPSSGWRTVNASWLLKLARLDISLKVGDNSDSNLVRPLLWTSFLSRRLHHLSEGNPGRSVFVTLWLCFGWPAKNCTVLLCCKFLFLTCARWSSNNEILASELEEKEPKEFRFLRHSKPLLNCDQVPWRERIIHENLPRSQHVAS